MPRRGFKPRMDLARARSDLRRVQKQLMMLERTGQLRAEIGMKKEADGVLKRSRALCPVSTEPYYKQGRKITRGGRLKKSGRIVQKRGSRRNRKEWEIIYGGKSVNGIFVDYAAAVHERTDLRHKKGKAKFLEIAMKEGKRGASRRVAKEVEDGVRVVLRR
jgi:hypothetical protein